MYYVLQRFALTITRYHIQQNTKSNLYHKVKISLWTKDAFKANPNSHQFYISFSGRDREAREGEKRKEKKKEGHLKNFLLMFSVSTHLSVFW